MTLRYYQDDGITKCANALSEFDSICYQLPTGGGKTVMFCEITRRFLTRTDEPVLIVVHRNELMNQTRNKLFLEYDIIATEIKAGMKEIPQSKVYVCMVESLSRRLKKIPKIGLLILDECHIAVHNKIIDNIDKRLAIGFSASPISSNKKEPLNKRYKTIVTGPQIGELISRKYLSQNITYAPRTGVDRNNLKTKGGDFDEVEMGKEFSKPKYVINTVEAYKKWALNTKTIIFNVNIDHSRAVYEEFKQQGFNVKYIDSKADPSERTSILEWLKVTPDAILCNVGILTTGFDEPTIETVIVNKATMSLALWLQMTGRGGRIIDEQLSNALDVPEKYSFTIIDMGMNAITHGDWCDDRDWKDIFENPIKKSKNGVSPSKNCPICEAILHAAALNCKYCNFIFPPKELALEELLNDYVVLTKNIDIEKIIEESNKKKQYFAFFKLVRVHVSSFKKTKQKVDNEKFEFMLTTCGNDIKKWCNLNNKKFNQWHKQLLLTELQKELNYEHRIL
jgi:superfamily II DNA or RNA helicase